jgi:hypothetical protein
MALPILLDRLMVRLKYWDQDLGLCVVQECGGRTLNMYPNAMVLEVFVGTANVSTAILRYEAHPAVANVWFESLVETQ